MMLYKPSKLFLIKSAQEIPIRLKFNIDIPDDLKELADLFNSNGEELYLVGGAVRDSLQGKSPKDYDVATGAEPKRVIEIVSNIPGVKVLEVGQAFGIVMIITPEGNEYEIATFRKDIGAGRRPDAVEFTTIEEDVKRRDLSINALFYDIKNKEVVDYVGGIEDIKNSTVRAVGAPSERFAEDRLRILRVIRFAARMGAQLDPDTANAIKEDNSLEGISKERIRDEFLKALKSASDPNNVIKLVTEFDLWGEIFPGLSIELKPVSSRDPIIVLSLLLRENNPDTLARALNSLKYTNKEVEQVKFLTMFQDLDLDNVVNLKKMFDKSNLTDTQLEEYSSESGMPDNRLVSAFIEFRLGIKGSDVAADGFKGPEMGAEIKRREIEKFKELL